MKNFKLRRPATIIGYAVLVAVLFSSCFQTNEQYEVYEPPKTYQNGHYNSFAAKAC